MTILTRRLLALGVAGSVILGAGGLALAQNDKTAPKAPTAAKGGRPGRMQALNLTPDQQAKIKALRADFNKRYMAILTPEQRQKVQAQRRMRRGNMRRGGKQGLRGAPGGTKRAVP